ncbi:hypothetical protein R50072_32230 [Simiduia litorea]
MGFQCAECGYKGKQSSQGACPACGSFKLALKSNLDSERENSDKRRRLKSIALVLLWLYLAFLISQKIYGS